jgi:hypothetical protein
LKSNAFGTIDTPGPGNYEFHHKNKTLAPSYAMGSKLKDLASGGSIAPSANAYNPSMSFTQKASAKWGFGSDTRKSLGGGGSVSPGPGNY